jgi:toxin ParE1/3/4
LTKNGYGDMVVMSIEAYERHQFESAVYLKLKEAELEAKISDKRFSQKEVFDELKAKISGRMEADARKDLTDIITYIADHLKAPKAAMDSLNELDKSISRLEQYPYSCKVYQPIKGSEHEYRLLPVKNYAVFYVVKEQVVEIHRVVYAEMYLTKNGK